jgi:TolB protein
LFDAGDLNQRGGSDMRNLSLILLLAILVGCLPSCRPQRAPSLPPTPSPPTAAAARAADAERSHLGQIAFTSDRSRTGQAYLTNPGASMGQVCLMGADGSGVRKLTEIAGCPAFRELEWSPDGRELMFVPVEVRTLASAGICVVNADGRRLRTLVSDHRPDVALHGDAHWSPDGSRICFIGTDPKHRGQGDHSTATTGAGVFVVNRDGTGLRAVVPVRDGRDCYSPSWSPDGARLAFIENRLPQPGGRPTCSIAVVNVDGSGHAVLWKLPQDWSREKGAVARWSPDGSHLAYSFGMDVGEGARCISLITIVPHARPAARQLPTGDEHAGYWWRWSPDGKSIAFVRWNGKTSRLYALQTASGLIRDLTSSAFEVVHFLTWSPDGTHIAFYGLKAAGERGIYAIRADGSALTSLTRAESLVPPLLAWRPVPAAPGPSSPTPPGSQ